MALRQEVLNLYRQIIRLSYNWTSACGNVETTAEERQYIRTEAGRLFRKNQQVQEEDAIRDYIKEGETRLELGVHYHNPYPRPIHLPQHVLHSAASKRLKTQKRKLQESKPIYVKSLDDDR